MFCKYFDASLYPSKAPPEPHHVVLRCTVLCNAVLCRTMPCCTLPCRERRRVLQGTAQIQRAEAPSATKACTKANRRETCELASRCASTAMHTCQERLVEAYSLTTRRRFTTALRSRFILLHSRLHVPTVKEAPVVHANAALNFR